jgi:AcrR family transcriptional regulator
VTTARLTRREKQEQTRSRILDGALGVFRSRGYARGTIEDVAELAGCTRGTVYLHFGSKEGLFVAVVELHLEDQVAAFRARLDAARNEQELFDLLLSTVAPVSQRSTLLLDWAVMVGDLQDGDPDLLRRAQQVQVRVDDELGALVQRLCDARTVRPAQSPARLARLLLSLGNGLTARAALDAGLDLSAELALAVDLLLAESAR